MKNVARNNYFSKNVARNNYFSKNVAINNYFSKNVARNNYFSKNVARNNYFKKNAINHYFSIFFFRFTDFIQNFRFFKISKCLKIVYHFFQICFRFFQILCVSLLVMLATTQTYLKHYWVYFFVKLHFNLSLHSAQLLFSQPNPKPSLAQPPLGWCTELNSEISSTVICWSPPPSPWFFHLFLENDFEKFGKAALTKQKWLNIHFRPFWADFALFKVIFRKIRGGRAALIGDLSVAPERIVGGVWIALNIYDSLYHAVYVYYLLSCLNLWSYDVNL